MLLKVNSDGFIRALDRCFLFQYHPANPNTNIIGITTDSITINTVLGLEPPSEALPVVNSAQVPVEVSTCIVLVAFIPVGNPQSVLEIDA